MPYAEAVDKYKDNYVAIHYRNNKKTWEHVLEVTMNYDQLYYIIKAMGPSRHTRALDIIARCSVKHQSAGAY